MFQFPGFALARTSFTRPGSPIRIRADQVLLADPRTFSQLTASFFAAGSLGILRSPFVTSLDMISYSSRIGSL